MVRIREVWTSNVGPELFINDSASSSHKALLKSEITCGMITGKVVQLGNLSGKTK